MIHVSLKDIIIAVMAAIISLMFYDDSNLAMSILFSLISGAFILGVLISIIKQF